MVDDVVLNVSEREIVFPDGGEVFDPFRDGELFDGDLFGHEMPPKRKYSARKEVKEVEEGDDAERSEGQQVR